MLSCCLEPLLRPCKRTLRTHELGYPELEGLQFFRRLYRILCLGFSSFGGERGLIYHCPLETDRATASSAVSFHVREPYRDKSYNDFVIIGTTSRYIEVCYRVSPSGGLTRASWADQPLVVLHVCMFRCFMFKWKTNSVPIFSHFMPYVAVSIGIA